MTGTQVDPTTSALGQLSRVTRKDVPILYLDVDFDVEAIQAGWPEFESRFTSTRGRKMMAVVFPEQGVYRLATEIRDEDDPDLLGLDLAALPGGDYLRLTLVGEAPSVYRGIGPAFVELAGIGRRDPSRPSIELYRRHDEIDCLMPVLS
jgi:hypothetical protein